MSICHSKFQTDRVRILSLARRRLFVRRHNSFCVTSRMISLNCIFRFHTHTHTHTHTHKFYSPESR